MWTNRTLSILLLEELLRRIVFVFYYYFCILHMNDWGVIYILFFMGTILWVKVIGQDSFLLFKSLSITVHAWKEKKIRGILRKVRMIMKYEVVTQTYYTEWFSHLRSQTLNSNIIIYSPVVINIVVMYLSPCEPHPTTYVAESGHTWCSCTTECNVPSFWETGVLLQDLWPPRYYLVGPTEGKVCMNNLVTSKNMFARRLKPQTCYSMYF